MLVEHPTHFNIKTLSEDDRPREKLYHKGSSAISDAELLAIILGSGSRQDTAVQLAQKILYKYDNSLDVLAKANIEDLMVFNGVGMAKAISIVACLEISRRRKLQVKAVEKPPLRSSAMLFSVFEPHLLDKEKEHFMIIYMNHKLQLIKTDILSIGNESATIVDVKLIAREAIKSNAKFICIGHNHPSGNTKPSLADKKITEKIKDALYIFEINLVDHIIVGNQSYFSFADENLLINSYA